MNPHFLQGRHVILRYGAAHQQQYLASQPRCSSAAVKRGIKRM